MPNNRRRLSGAVVSNKMDKTVVVEVETRFRHPLYGKVISTSRRFKAHDEDNACELGDTVVIVESRPISRTKRWVVQEIIRQDLSAQTTDVSGLTGLPEEEVVSAAATASSESDEDAAEVDEE